jgi:ubiquinone biosynthesis protein UbiJ
MANSPLIAPLEALLNRAIAGSTPARSRLRTLTGRAFALRILIAPNQQLLRLRLVAGESTLAVSIDDDPADAVVSGTPLALLALLAGRGSGRTGTTGVSIEGDAETVQAFEKLLQEAQPDVEAELARLIGDTPAHHLSQITRSGIDWFRRATDAMARNVGEYLTEESRDTVARTELDIWLSAVDHLREDVDRAEARVVLLEQRAFRGRTVP